MNIRLIAIGFVLGAVTAMVSTPATSQEGIGGRNDAAAPTPQEMQDMMKAWMEAITPGEHHKLLEQFVGSWTTTTRIYWGGPGSPPMETAGSSVRTWVLDGRFVLEKNEGELFMPDENGAMKKIKTSGMGLTGFDNYRKVFSAVWADSLNTQLLTMKGSVDASGKLFTYYGEMDEPMLGVVGRTVKYVTRVTDENTHVFEIYDLHAGDDYKVVEITYTRNQD